MDYRIIYFPALAAAILFPLSDKWRNVCYGIAIGSAATSLLVK